MTAYLSLIVGLVGLVVYAMSAAPKPAEVGRLMFGAGLLAFLLSGVAAHVTTLVR